jgi:hypothetical protein
LLDEDAKRERERVKKTKVKEKKKQYFNVIGNIKISYCKMYFDRKIKSSFIPYI